MNVSACALSFTVFFDWLYPIFWGVSGLYPIFWGVSMASNVSGLIRTIARILNERDY